jgi:hypothetical protein
MAYYYFAATLPSLSLDAPPPFSIEAFREQCREHLAASDLARLDELLADDSAVALGDERGGEDFTQRWRSLDIQMRNAVARLRAARARRDAAPYVRTHGGVDASLEKRAADALGKENPLERERALDALRWSLLDELGGTDPFAPEALLAYALKLRIVRRWAEIGKDDGRERAQSFLPDPEEWEDGLDESRK